MSILTGPPRETAMNLRFGKTFEHAAGERRKLGDDNLGIADEIDDIIGLAHIFLQSVHALDGIAMLHRLIRPGLFQKTNVMRVAAGFHDLVVETSSAA